MGSEEFGLERIQPLGERAVKLAVLRGRVADIPHEAGRELLHLLSARLLHLFDRADLLKDSRPERHHRHAVVATEWLAWQKF